MTQEDKALELFRMFMKMPRMTRLALEFYLSRVDDPASLSIRQDEDGSVTLYSAAVR